MQANETDRFLARTVCVRAAVLPAGHFSLSAWQYSRTKRLLVSALRMVVSIAPLALFGCDAVPVSQNASPNGSDVAPGVVASDNSDVLDPAGLPPMNPEDATVTFQMERAFCCNRLTYEFEVILPDSYERYGLTVEWDFGDGRAGQGERTSHTYPWAADYLVTVAVRHPNQEKQLAHQWLRLGSGDVESSDVISSPVGPESPGLGGSGPYLNLASVQPAAPGTDVTLSARVEPLSMQDDCGFRWSQTVGPRVSLRSANTHTATFIAPDAPGEPLTFTVTATCPNGVISERVDVEIAAVQGGLIVIPRQFLVIKNTPGIIDLEAITESVGEVQFAIEAPPTHGTLGPISSVGPTTATVTYVPNVDYEGDDSFRVRAVQSGVSSDPVEIQIEVIKRIIPWMEVNAPLASADSIYTPEQGAEPGMTRLDFFLAGLPLWSQVTDTVIVTTQSTQIENLYPELMGRLPPGMRVIGGVKTMILPGAAPGDPRSYDFADAATWRVIAVDVQRIAELTGTPTVVLENETAMAPFTHGEASIELDSLAAALAPLAAGNVATWWWLPWIMGGDPDKFPERQVASTALTSTVASAVPTAVFMTEYVSGYGWENASGVVQRRRLMDELVGASRVQEGLFVTPDGLLRLSETTRRVYTPTEAVDAIRNLSRDDIRVFPGGANWLLVGEAFSDSLPPLATGDR